jgi:Mg/Co/Ni transporter MgtE
MNGSRLVRALSTGFALGFALLLIIIMGGIVFAVSGRQSIKIPLLMSASSGAGKNLLGLAVQPLGFLIWLVAFSFLSGIPLALARRNSDTRQEVDHR